MFSEWRLAIRCMSMRRTPLAAPGMAAAVQCSAMRSQLRS